MGSADLFPYAYLSAGTVSEIKENLYVSLPTFVIFIDGDIYCSFSGRRKAEYSDIWEKHIMLGYVSGLRRNKNISIRLGRENMATGALRGRFLPRFNNSQGGMLGRIKVGQVAR